MDEESKKLEITTKKINFKTNCEEFYVMCYCKFKWVLKLGGMGSRVRDFRLQITRCFRTRTTGGYATHFTHSNLYGLRIWTTMFSLHLLKSPAEKLA